MGMTGGSAGPTQKGTEFSRSIRRFGYPAIIAERKYMGLASVSAIIVTALAAASSGAGEDAEPGLVYVFFNGADFTRPAETGLDAQIDLDTGTTINDYSRLWLGSIVAPIEGEVTFSVEADNGCRLMISDNLVIDGWSEDGPREGTWRFASPHMLERLRLEHYQRGGTSHIRLYWQWPGHPRELVPPAAFRHTASDVDRAATMMVEPVGAESVPVSAAHARLYTPGQPTPTDEPVHLAEGPYLFIDDYLIADSNNIERVVNVPERDPGIPNPIVTGKEDGCFQPYMTILQDPATGRFRIWFGRPEGDSMSRSVLGYMESNDGIRWERPARVLDSPRPIQFGVSVVDRGPEHTVPAQRYVFGWYMDGGFKVATSPDGFDWTPLNIMPVIYHNHDISGLYYDPLYERYIATVSVYRPGPAWSGKRRITMHSFSTNLIEWTTPHYVILPDDSIDPGETQFYAMDGYLRRGDLLIGMVKVLRDDLKADEPPDPPDAYGVGYTSLAWSRDGETWCRDTAHIFDPDPQKGAWDHAHAWIDEQVHVDDEVYLYYGGYARGHKVNRFEERQIGLVKIKRDRYIAREAGVEPGLIKTPLVVLEGEGLTLNVDARDGEIRAQATEADGKPLPGFAFEDCTPINTDSLTAPVTWKRPFSEISGKPLRLEFYLKNARLFAFDVE